MTRDKILSRLLEDGYITFRNLDILVNKKIEHTDIVQDLFDNCKITSKESIILLEDSDFYNKNKQYESYRDIAIVYESGDNSKGIQEPPYGYPYCQTITHSGF